jgi:hypothetical protein
VNVAAFTCVVACTLAFGCTGGETVAATAPWRNRWRIASNALVAVGAVALAAAFIVERGAHAVAHATYVVALNGSVVVLVLAALSVSMGYVLVVADRLRARREARR